MRQRKSLRSLLGYLSPSADILHNLIMQYGKDSIVRYFEARGLAEFFAGSYGLCSPELGRCYLVNSTSNQLSNGSVKYSADYLRFFRVPLPHKKSRVKTGRIIAKASQGAFWLEAR